MSNPQQPHGLRPTRLLRPWDFPGKSTGVGCHCLLRLQPLTATKLLLVSVEICLYRKFHINRVMDGLLWLASFTQYNVSKVYPCWSMCCYFILSHRNTLLRGYHSFCFSIAAQLSCSHCFDYYEWCCYEHSRLSFCVDGCFHFSSRFHFSRPRSWISGSQSNSVCNHLRNCQTAFQSNHTILHSYQQYMRAPISPHPWQHLLWSIFFITASQVGVEWYLIVVLICTLLMTNDVEHLFMRWLATCMSSLAI